MVASRARRQIWGSKVFLCYPRRSGSIRPGEAARASAQFSSALVRSTAQRVPHGGSPSNWTAQKVRGLLVCHCTSSRRRKTFKTLFQRLAGRTYRSGPVLRLPASRALPAKVMPNAQSELIHPARWAFVV